MEYSRTDYDDVILDRIFPDGISQFYDRYNRFKFFRFFEYQKFTIRKKSGGVRKIYSPSPKLLKQQLLILKFLQRHSHIVYKQSPCSFAYQKRIGVRQHAEQHLHSKVILKIDIKDFFESITFEDVHNVFKKVLYFKYQYTAKLLADICCHFNKLPQGAPTSPIISNLYFTQIDKRLEGLASSKNLIYTRYADDLYFSGDSIDSKLKSSVVKILKEYNLEINHRKTSLKKEGHKKLVTGVDISLGVTRAPKKMRRAFRQDCYELLKQVDKLEPCVLLKEFQSISGKAAYIKYLEKDSTSSIFKNYNILKNKILKMI